jgi:hypothetical protein
MTLSTFKYVLAAVGLALLLGSLAVDNHTASFVRGAARAQGTVTALVPQQSTDYGSITKTPYTRYTYQPVVRFIYKGQLIQFNDSVASSPPAYHVGETVSVLYRESNPYDARIDSFLSLWLIPLIFGGIGAIFLAIGAAMMFRSRGERV